MAVKKMKQHIDLEDSHLKKNPFKVPDGYFLSVEKEVWDKIHAETVAESENGHVGFVRIVKPFLSMAATFAIIAAIGVGVLQLTGNRYNTTGEESLAGNENTAEEFYIDLLDNYPLYNNNELIENTIDLLSEEWTDDDNDNTGYEITDDEIEQFLISENVSILSLAALENINQQ